MSDKITYITSEGLQKLKSELENLKNVKRVEIANRIKEAKELGDLSENAEYADAREDQSFTEGRIMEIESMLKNIKVIEPGESDPNVVNIGDTVSVEKDGEAKTYTIVGSNEANPDENKISNESPLGVALLGKKLNEEFKAHLPKGEIKFKITNIKAS